MHRELPLPPSVPFRPRKIAVFGSINQDVVVRCDRCPAAGETRVAQGLEFLPGGKGANQAVAARLYAGNDENGPQVSMIGQVGDDPFGTSLVNYLRSRGLNLQIDVDRHAATGTALIVVEATGENRIVIVPGANGTIPAQNLDWVESLRENDLLVLQNEIPLDAIRVALSAAGKRGVVRIFNAAPALPLADELLQELDLLVLNETEYAIGFDEPLSLNEQLTQQLTRRRATLSCDLLVTLGERGAIYLQRENAFEVAGWPVKAVDTTGAGDCFVGAFVAQLAHGNSIPAGLEFANRAAALSITRPGASVSYPSLEEILRSSLVR